MRVCAKRYVRAHVWCGCVRVIVYCNDYISGVDTGMCTDVCAQECDAGCRLMDTHLGGTMCAHFILSEHSPHIGLFSFMVQAFDGCIY